MGAKAMMSFTTYAPKPAQCVAEDVLGMSLISPTWAEDELGGLQHLGSKYVSPHKDQRL